MGAPATTIRAAGPMRGLIYVKKALDPQIRSDGAIQAEMRDLLELL
jgi:hypothetical protein